jgi:hexosaminidase
MKKLMLVLWFALPCWLQAQDLPIIPKPVACTAGEGSFLIDKNTAIVYSAAQSSLKSAAGFLASHIQHISGIQLSQSVKKSKSIILQIRKVDEIGKEGYLLNVTPTAITITANSRTGIIYGMQSLFQLLPAVRTNAALLVPAVAIKDYPRFKWRGMHLDVSRHFFSPDLIKEYIDLLAAYKFNTFHWHLTDDQGWRIEIKKYPKLTSVGAWRVDQTDKVWGQRPQAEPGEKADYGGYYTQDQIRDIVRYAAARNITIVPEIEMPGHSAAAIASYPFLSCSQKPQLPMTGGNYKDISSNYCAGNDSVFHFLQDVLDEVINLFPSQYIHIGGDEVDKTSWKNCPKCQARMRAEGLKDEEELQSYFIRRMEKYLISKHRKLIGWDEILEGGLAPEATVMSWRGEAGGVAAAKMQHDVVMTPGNPVYFDHYQGDPATEPLAIGGFNTLKRVYQYEPVPSELNADQAKYVLGAQANLWTEFVTTAEHVEYMVLPRMLALSEVLWSAMEQRNWASFNERLQHHFKAFDQLGLHYSKGNFKVEIKPLFENGKLKAALSTEIYKGEIYYSTDGTAPTVNSIKYESPVSIDSTLTLKAVVVVNGRVMSVLPSEQKFTLHKAVGKNVSYTNPVSPYYRGDGPNTLTDGIRGTYELGRFWHGFSGKDLIAVVDMGSATSIQSLSLGCLQHYRDWVMMPQWVKFEISDDAVHFQEVGTVQNDVPVNASAAIIKDFSIDFSPRSARYIRVSARVLDALPKGHPGAGSPAWLFADEIVVR